ncbi:glycosyl transferase family 1 [Bradyrhizobium jicamae]|uniref:Glycosyl transferase family 1 n=1 Tax=Bradyrhizobium jicamae TaxID=280332 RepID=A0A0R3LA27_9BRAD|nr:glycosyltransferase [Bradyrhizobium jicamae]KRR01939.1 glycosyl transferase family 1 [Bradyrhizobium jicamae]
MSLATPDIDRSTLGLHSLEQYAPIIGRKAAERIAGKAERLSTLRVAHVSSTFYGGGVTEILTPLTLMMNAIGIETDWHLIQGTPAFFGCTKKLHNMLQGADIDFPEVDRQIYEQVVFENATRIHVEECDAVIVHDPQPLPLAHHIAERRMPWFWQCHVDLSSPHPPTWKYLRQFIGQYDAAIFSLPEYGQNLGIDELFVTPAINPFAAKNVELSDSEIDDCLSQHGIPPERPLVAQVSRFDVWKDPKGVIEAFRKARKEVDCTLVLIGNNASDDPEGETILEDIKRSIDDDIIVLAVDDPILVNALQRRAAVILQKSTREGFGLTVTEAMWKGAAVIGGNVGGIRRQIVDGDNGFLVDGVDQAAERIVQILKDPALRRRLGRRAKESVREKFLMSRLLEDWLDILARYQRPV